MRKLFRWAVAAILLCPIPGLAQTVVLPGSGSGTSSGSSVAGCTAYSLVYIDSAGNLACALAPVNGNVSTAGRGIFKVLDTITGASATSNFLNITGTLPASISTATSGSYFSTTSGGDTGNSDEYGIYSTVTGTTGASAKSRIAIYGYNIGSSSGRSIGVAGESAINTASKIQIGVWGGATPQNASSGTVLGVVGVAGSSSGTPTYQIGVQGLAGGATSGTNRIGGYFGFSSSYTVSAFAYATPTGTAALIADNVAVAANIFEARDNGTETSTTAASANVTILDGAQMRLGNQVLTSGDMTPTIVGEVRTVTHSYAWTNAMVTALGAALTGDIVVADLPAKTRVDEALLVIDTAAAGTTTLTVSCGDAIVGTPFTGYILASDAKAAANTVYGDLISGAETGASLFDATTKWFPNYVPSYTATTRISCHFIATGTNLDTVTTSTGRLILTTTLLP